jgi:hypothetical protein
MNGFNVRLTKYKLIIYEEQSKECTEKDAQIIAQYLWEEGFINKDNFPVEIVQVED